MYPSAELNGDGKPGVSSGAVLRAVQETAREKLPRGYSIDWAGISRDEVNAGNEGIYVFVHLSGLRVPGARGAVRELRPAARR